MTGLQNLKVALDSVKLVGLRMLEGDALCRLALIVLFVVAWGAIPAAQGVMIDLSGGTPAGFTGMTTYTAPNGTVVTSSYGTWPNNSADHYYMRYLFDGSLGNTQTDVWLTNNGGATTGNTLTIALDQPYFLDYVRVRADALTGWRSNYQLEASADNVNWTNVTGGYVNTQSDAPGTGHNHSILANTQYLRFDLTKLASLNGVSLNEIQLFALTDGTLVSTPVSGSSIVVGGLASAGQTVTSLGAIELSNLGGADTVVTIDGYSITGTDAAQFAVTSFSTAVLLDGDAALFDLSYTALTEGSASALLTFMTSVGDISFTLEAAYVPEPGSSTILLGVFGCAAMMRRRRRRG